MAIHDYKLICAALLVLVCVALCQAANKNYSEFCTKNDTCLGDTVCQMRKGCKYGSCNCKKDYVRIKGNNCKELKKFGEACSENYDCFTSVCTNDKCACAPGFEVAKDKKLCGKFVGKACSSKTSGNECGAYMVCMDSKCACQPSHKEKDGKCIPHYLGEDCSDGKQCYSPGRCTNNMCSCNNNLVPYLKYYCIHKDATKDLRAGESCTGSMASPSDRVCGKDLKCKECPNEGGKSVCAGAASIQAGILSAAFTAILTFFHLYTPSHLITT